MHYIALIPFLVLFISYVVFRIELVYAAFIALLSCVAIAGAAPLAFTNTLIFLFEIGLIIFGAFYFIEVAENKGVIQSLADLVREVSSNRIVQSILVSFPLCLIVEGSSGFGTPLLIIAPILRALGLPLILCAVLPLMNMINGIPFGALGTPIRLGFSNVTDQVLPIAQPTIISLSPFFWYIPLLSFFLIRKKLQVNHEEKKPVWILWILMLTGVYANLALTISEHNLEFPVLAGALITFIVGIFSAHFIEKKKLLFPHHRKGLVIYTLLLTTLWIGKRIWMDEKFPGIPLRIFNPGWIFIIFGLILSRSGTYVMPALHRARKTILILFCMTFIVQQLKISGSMQELLTHLPAWLLNEGTPILGWLSSAMIGTGTVSILFLSPLVAPKLYGSIAASTALGVPLAFQAIVGVKSILKDDISEKAILKLYLPISISILIIAMIFRQLTLS